MAKLSDEEILNYEILKNKYLQQSVSLLTKANLEKLERHCQRQLCHEVGQIFREHEIVLELLDRYKQLEQKANKHDSLVEKIEDTIKELEKQSGGNVFHIQQTINSNIRLLQKLLKEVEDE